MNLFLVKDHKLIINVEEVRAFPYIAKILGRDNSTGKNQAYKEMMFIWNWSNYQSPWRAYVPAEMKFTKCRINSNLPSNFIMDDVIKGAIKEYEQAQLDATPSVRIVQVLEEGINLSIEGVNNLNKIITEKLNKLQTAGVESKDTGTIIGGLIQNINTLMDLSNDFPKALDNLDKVKNRLILETKKKKVLRGGGEKGMFEDRESINKDDHEE